MTSPDIRERAERLASRFLEYGKQDRNYPGLVNLISQALTAEREAGRAEERERHAENIETLKIAYAGGGDFTDGAKAVLADLAAAVRNPET